MEHSERALRIAFGGRAGSGKDTAVDYLIQRYGGEHLKFAQPLYDILEFAQDRCKFPKVKDRKFLQWIGTEWGRDQDTHIWVKLLLSSLDDLPEHTNVFISDVRFPNEHSALRKAGFTLVKLNRNSVSNSLSPEARHHRSETSLDSVTDWDCQIENDGTLDDLYQSLIGIVTFYKNRLKPTKGES